MSALKWHITIKHKAISNLPSEPCPPITSSPQIISSPAKVPTLPISPCPQHESVIYNCATSSPEVIPSPAKVPPPNIL